MQAAGHSSLEHKVGITFAFLNGLASLSYLAVSSEGAPLISSFIVSAVLFLIAPFVGRAIARTTYQLYWDASYVHPTPLHYVFKMVQYGALIGITRVFVHDFMLSIELSPHAFEMMTSNISLEKYELLENLLMVLNTHRAYFFFTKGGEQALAGGVFGILFGLINVIFQKFGIF